MAQSVLSKPKDKSINCAPANRASSALHPALSSLKFPFGRVMLASPHMRTSLVFLLAATFSGPTSLWADRAPLKLPDVVAWKRIQTPSISNDGQWFAYKRVPNDGNSDV